MKEGNWEARHGKKKVIVAVQMVVLLLSTASLLPASPTLSLRSFAFVQGERLFKVRVTADFKKSCQHAFTKRLIFRRLYKD